MTLDDLLSLVFFGVLVLFNSIVGQTQPRFHACSRRESDTISQQMCEWRNSSNRMLLVPVGKWQ